MPSLIASRLPIRGSRHALILHLPACAAGRTCVTPVLRRPEARAALAYYNVGAAAAPES